MQASEMLTFASALGTKQTSDNKQKINLLEQRTVPSARYQNLDRSVALHSR